jgi:hypothetical protein
VQPGGGEYYVVIVDLAFADFESEGVETGLVAKFFDGTSLAADVFFDASAEGAHNSG